VDLNGVQAERLRQFGRVSLALAERGYADTALKDLLRVPEAQINDAVSILFHLGRLDLSLGKIPQESRKKLAGTSAIVP
jgi:hypothetical protein